MLDTLNTNNLYGSPYHNLALDFAIASQANTPSSAQTITCKTPAAQPLKYFSVVGAMFSGDMQMYDKDLNTVIDTLVTLKESGIPIDAKPEFRFYNLLAPINADFLDEAFLQPQPSDVVILSYIFGKKSQNAVITDGFSKEQIFEPYNDFRYMYNDYRFRIGKLNREVTISERQLHSDTIWSDACKNVGAKIVVTRANDNQEDTVNTAHFERASDFKPVIHNTSANISSRYRLGNLGFSVSELAIQDLASIAHDANDLGRQLKYQAR